MPDPRTPSDSRCSQPMGAPYRWVNNVDDSHASVVRYDEHFAMMHPPLRAITVGEIEELFDAAARGDLEESGDEYEALKPIVSDPEIWELLVHEPAEYRFYHGEPPKYPQVLVKLHRHIKDDAAAQQDEINHAISRYYPNT